MRKNEIFIRIVALSFAVAAITVSYGREMLISALAERRVPQNAILGREAVWENSANAKLERKIMQMQKTSQKTSVCKGLPFLCKDIKYSCRETDNEFLYFNSNQLMLCDKWSGICLYYRYDCEIGEPRHSYDECLRAARKGVYTAFSSFRTPRITSVSGTLQKDGTYTFFVKTNVTGESEIVISVRSDTGSIVLFDALSCRDIVANALLTSF